MLFAFALLDFASTDGTKAAADIERIAKAENFSFYFSLNKFLVKTGTLKFVPRNDSQFFTRR